MDTTNSTVFISTGYIFFVYIIASVKNKQIWSKPTKLDPDPVDISQNNKFQLIFLGGLRGINLTQLYC